MGRCWQAGLAAHGLPAPPARTCYVVGPGGSAGCWFLKNRRGNCREGRRKRSWRECVRAQLGVEQRQDVYAAAQGVLAC